MLVTFRVENFKSFKDFTEFSMEATKLKNLQESNTFQANTISLLNSAVIYGANASGKSSLLDAMAEIQNIINNSISIKETKQYSSQPFLLNTQTEAKESFFEIEFIIDEVIYRYGFTITTNAIILKEWLFHKKLQSNARESRLFERKNQSITLATLFKEGKGLENKTRNNTLFLSVLAQFNGTISGDILEWFNQFNIISNIKSDEFKHYSFDKLEDEAFKDKIVTLIKSADIGIYDISKKKISFDDLVSEMGEVEELKENGVSTVETKHLQYDKDNAFNHLKSFELNVESDGTQKLLALSAPIIDTLINGRVLIIDELDNSMHTTLVNAIIQLFNSKETNPNNAQLIFTTHDTNLLNQELFRRDQIWFTQKDIYGVSELYSLIEYGKGKTKDNFLLEENYLDGKFGAVPYINGLEYEVE